jgi:hypothetical protein
MFNYVVSQLGCIVFADIAPWTVGEQQDDGDDTHEQHDGYVEPQRLDVP